MSQAQSDYALWVMLLPIAEVGKRGIEVMVTKKWTAASLDRTTPVHLFSEQ
jgi:hypothetical protein